MQVSLLWTDAEMNIGTMVILTALRDTSLSSSSDLASMKSRRRFGKFAYGTDY